MLGKFSTLYLAYADALTKSITALIQKDDAQANERRDKAIAAERALLQYGVALEHIRYDWQTRILGIERIEKGCDEPSCNIGGGLCAECSDAQYTAWQDLIRVVKSVQENLS